MKSRFGKNDLILISIILTIIFIFIIIFYAFNNKKGNVVIITLDGELYGTYSLDDDITVEIKNSNDHITNKLIISEGYANMIEADCPDKLCVHQKKISLDKESIVCLPNKIVVMVSSEEESGLDAIAK